MDKQQFAETVSHCQKTVNADVSGSLDNDALITLYETAVEKLKLSLTIIPKDIKPQVTERLGSYENRLKELQLRSFGFFSILPTFQHLEIPFFSSSLFKYFILSFGLCNNWR